MKRRSGESKRKKRIKTRRKERRSRMRKKMMITKRIWRKRREKSPKFLCVAEIMIGVCCSTTLEYAVNCRVTKKMHSDILFLIRISS